ncbi:TPA: hypothetical protein ACH3X2_007105 [Trebouxia sp. C0005]
MAEGKSDGPAKKAAFSSRLMQMKFMQRGKEKAVVKEAVTAQAKVVDDSEWVAEGQQTGCTVLAEGDPLPSAHFGHMSFSSFNPELQKLQEQRETMLKAARKAALLGAEGKAIPDTEEAEQLPNVQRCEATGQQSDQLNGRKGRMAEGKHVSSMREGRSKPHRTGKDSSSKSGHKRKRRHGSK